MYICEILFTINQYLFLEAGNILVCPNFKFGLIN